MPSGPISTDPTQVVVGLGTNLNLRLSPPLSPPTHGESLHDRATPLRSALQALQALPATVLAEPVLAGASPRSAFYDSPPAGGPPQGNYLNAAVLLETSLGLDELMLALLTIERAHGRIRPDPVRWGPRTLDLDLLWASRDAKALRFESTHVTLPHPRLHERDFAMLPLLDVAPNAHCPHTGRAYADIVRAFGESSTQRLSLTWETDNAG